MSANSNQPREGERRRIVIPLGREQRGVSTSRTVSQARLPPSSPRRSRLVRILVILGIAALVVALLMVGGYFLWWQRYKATPEYTLALLIDAAQRNDIAAVEAIIDMDQVVKNFAGEVTDKAANRYGLALGGGAREQIQALTPKLLPRIKDNVNSALIARVKEISEKADHKPFIMVALGIPYLVNVAVNGDSAKATALVQNQSVELDMRRAENGWKIVAYRDEAMVQRAIDQVIKDLPAVGVGRESKGTDAGKHTRVLPPIPLRIP